MLDGSANNQELRRVVLGGAMLSFLLASPTPASAQDLSESLRVQGGYTHEDHGPQGKIDDVWVGAIPEIALTVDRPRTIFKMTYSLTGNLHSDLPTELNNRLVLSFADEISKRLTLTASAEGYQTSLSSLLTTVGAADDSLSALPAPTSRFLGVHGTETLSWDAAPRLLLRETLEAGYVTSLDDQPTNNLLESLTVSAERTWKRDAVGLEVRGQYASQVTTAGTQKVVTVTAGPRWRHDFSDRLSGYLMGGGTLAFSPDGGSLVLASAARGSLLYTVGAGGVELNGVSGVEPNLLTGQILRVNQATLRGFVPISEKNRVTTSASFGFQTVDSVVVQQTSIANANATGSFHGIIADAEIAWLATDRVQLFLRYQFLDQIADDNPLANPSFWRMAGLGGVQVYLQPPETANVRFRTPRRVDGGDAAPAARDKP